MYLQIHIQQVVDASDPDQASANPIPTSCRCFQPQPGICKSNSNKLQMLPTPARHLQIQFQQVADASDPDQASANPIPASCGCFQPRPGICKSNSSKLQMLPTPGYVSANSYPASCRCFQPRPGICKSNSNKLQMLPTPTRHLQIQFQQIADAFNPGQASANPIPASCRCFHVRSSPLYVSANPIPTSCRCFRPQDMYLQIHIQQIADASDPDQASANPIPASCRCFRTRPGICKSNSSKLQMLPTPTRHL